MDICTCFPRSTSRSPPGSSERLVRPRSGLPCRLAASDPETVTAAITYWTTQLRPGEFPELTALYRAGAAAQATEHAAPPMTPNALTHQFEQGLAALLDGLSARLRIA